MAPERALSRENHVLNYQGGCRISGLDLASQVGRAGSRRMNTPVHAYRDAYRRAQEDPEGFWSERAEALHWERRWDRVLDASRAPFYRWFPGGRISTCYNALDRHVEQGRGEQAALIYDSPVTGTVAQLTYRELRERVACFAGALAAQGVGRGDRVVIYIDRKSTRLNSSHTVISYAVFCLKKKNNKQGDADVKLALVYRNRRAHMVQTHHLPPTAQLRVCAPVLDQLDRVLPACSP